MSTRVRLLAVRVLLALAVVVAAYVVVPVTSPAFLPTAAAAQPVSGAFALGGGLDGSIDPRTGRFSISLPLTTIDGTGSADLSLSLGWDQARAGLGLDRYGFGGGWGLGVTFIETTGNLTVYPANGGAYTVDSATWSRLHDYPLQDLRYTRLSSSVNGILYSHRLDYDDGRSDYFDANGNLVVRRDRFGNLTTLTWSANGTNRWRLNTVTSSDGLATTFGYAGNTITVSAPKRSDGVVAKTTVLLDNNLRVSKVTDPAGSVANFYYTSVSGVAGTYLNVVVGPAGARSQVVYKTISYPGTSPLLIGQTLTVTDQLGKQLAPARTFDLNPSGNNSHNYAGYPNHLSATTDALFDSGDQAYQYSTSITNGKTTTISTYDSGHRLVGRRITVNASSGIVTVQRQALTYPKPAPPPQVANYSRPTTSTITFSATSGPAGVSAASGSRTVSASTHYDSHGRIDTATDEAGTTTRTSYDPTYGLVLSTDTLGADGSHRTVTNTLTPTGNNIHSTTEKVAKPGGTLSARTVTSYQYDPNGDVNQRTVAWAPGAAPADDAGPGSTTTTYRTTVNAAAATKSVAVTVADQTTAATTTTTVLDLVSGRPVSVTDALGRTTNNSYDAVGRLTGTTPPTGLTISTSYTPATTSSPASKLETGPDGHKTLTTYDVLGRTVEVTDNVQNTAFVSDPTTRVVSSHSFSADGSTLTSVDLAGRTTIVVSDPLGQQVSREGDSGITVRTTHNDVANSTTAQTIGNDTTATSQTVLTRYDDLGRTIFSRTTYPFSSGGRALFLADPTEQNSYDGVGRTTAVTTGDLTTTPDYAGAGGVPVDTVVAPTDSAKVQSPPITVTDATMIDASPSLRTLQQPGQPARSGTKTVLDAAGRITSTTDPLGRTTSYTYTADGQLFTRTTPLGTVTTNTYDPITGRLVKISSKPRGDNPTTTSYGYVPAGSPGAGRVRTLTNETGTITYGYDADGNTVSVSYPDGATVASSYLDSGLQHTSTDITGAVTTYVYNDDTSLKSATQTRAGVTLASAGYTYDGLDRLKTITRGNGLVTTNGYTPNNLLASQTTVDGSKNPVESHQYTYDSHHNLTKKTDVTAVPGRCPVICTASASTYGTWTTTYAYDAYDRLTGSAVYSGAAASGTPRTKLGYVLDVSGNVSQTTRTTTTAADPTGTTVVTTDQVDGAGQLQQRTVGGTSTNQSWDADGRLTTSLSGATTTYRPDGLPATVTSGGATTTFSYWADGTRKEASTTGATGGDSSVTFHYGTTGTLLNDTTTAAGGSATASYLLSSGREARTLAPGTTAAGRPAAGKAVPAPVTTGSGTGYYLRDRHSSVTAMVDSTGAVTSTYAYGDYGAPALLDGTPGSVVGAAAGTGAGQTNSLRYAGASLKALYSDTTLGTLMTPARFYDPGQGRFTAADVANVHNRYAGFDANPIMNVDPTGQSPLADFFIDAIYVIAFAVAAVVTYGAAAAAGAAIFGAAAATEATVATVGAFVAQTVATVANGVGLVSNGIRLADDIDNATTGKHFLSDDQRSDLSNIATVAGTVAGVAGMLGSGAEAASEAAEQVSGADPNAAKRLAVDALDPDGADSGAGAGGTNASSADDQPELMGYSDDASSSTVSSTQDTSTGATTDLGNPTTENIAPKTTDPRTADLEGDPFTRRFLKSLNLKSNRVPEEVGVPDGNAQQPLVPATDLGGPGNLNTSAARRLGDAVIEDYLDPLNVARRDRSALVRSRSFSSSSSSSSSSSDPE